MVNVDENFPMADAPADLAQTLETRAVGGDDAVEFHAAFRLLEQSILTEEFVFLREWIFIPAKNLFAFALERQCKTELRADTIPIGPDVSKNANRFAFADDVKNPINDFWITFHNLIFSAVGGHGFFQFPHDLQHAIATDDGIVRNKFQRRRVFQNNSAPDQTLDADTTLGKQLKPVFLLLGSAKDADENGRGLEVALHVHVIDGDQTGFADKKFTADDLADFALEQFADALESE
jgi:hypothetical protein